ncbi:uncharacterized protein LOC115797437 [Archocentrus centrarchus]|uniref:uncharacterized protein LOC115797437 n=1 Tax=Archocentrus centrarchus TaxID=63155 RepID=UPI0011E9FB65|nr:uncharacterized protein LOC115797437 [Archocentrus centrarchus]
MVFTRGNDSVKDLMERASPDLRVSEPPPQDLGISEGLRTSPLNTEALEDFAQNMSENIIQSVVTQKERVAPEVSIYNKDQEMLAEALASAVMEIALSEVSRGQNHMEGAEVEMENGKGEERELLDTAMHRVKEYHSSTQPYHPPLSQSGLPAVGSLDYPDAPPTTPLVPELERSRSSFARKLKGGLAKVFLPSPPPPTPKEKRTTQMVRSVILMWN